MRSSKLLPSTPVSTTIPLFLAPAFATSSTSYISAQQSRAFAVTCRNQNEVKRGNRDKNKKRGVSAIRSTGPKHPLSISKHPLPVPVRNPEKRAEFKARPDHGLWGFFNTARAPMVVPEEEAAHGRAWTYQELATKSFDDLHRLHWICIKELNQIATRENERRRLKAGFGQVEAGERREIVTKTMRQIRSVLSDRFISWQQARVVLDKTPVKDVFAGETEPAFDDFSTTPSMTPSQPATVSQR